MLEVTGEDDDGSDPAAAIADDNDDDPPAEMTPVGINDADDDEDVDDDGDVVVVNWENMDVVMDVVMDDVLMSLKALPTSSTILFNIIAQAFRIFSSSPTTVTHLSGNEKSVHFWDICT